MRRTLAVAATSAALVAGFTVPAQASTTTLVKTVSVDDATMDGGAVGSTYCGGTGFMPMEQTFMKVVAQADTANSPSAVSWAPNSAPVSGVAWGVGPSGTNALTAADLTTLKIDVQNGPSGVATLLAFSGNPMTVGKLFIGRSAIPAGASGAWSTVDESNATYAWSEFSLPTGSGSGFPAYKASAGSSTLAAFDTAHPSTQYQPLLAFGCAGESDFAVQHLQWGAGAPLNVEDFGTITNNVAIKPTASFVAAGGAVTINGSAQYGGAANATLSFRAATTSAYSTAARAASTTVVDDLTCAPASTSDPTSFTFACRNPFAGVTTHPMYNTIYRWSYPGTSGVDGANSGFITVHVQAAVAAAYPSSVSSGRSFSVTGKVNPLRPGTQVALWGRKGTSTVKLGTGTVSSTGAYKVNAAVGTGTWTVWVTTPNDKLNAAGKSAARTYSVR